MIDARRAAAVLLTVLFLLSPACGAPPDAGAPAAPAEAVTAGTRSAAADEAPAVEPRTGETAPAEAAGAAAGEETWTVTAAAAPAGPLGVGGSVDDGVLRFTLEGVRFPEVDVFGEGPEAGVRYVVFDGVIESVGSEPSSASSLLMFEGRTGDGRRSDMNIWLTESHLDGPVLPGVSRRGEVGFDMPSEAETAYLLVDLAAFASDTAVFEVDLTGGAQSFTAPAAVSVSDPLAVGDPVSNGELRFVLEAVELPALGGFDEPPEKGTRFLVLNGVFEAVGSAPVLVSSMSMFELLTPDGRKQEQDIFLSDSTLDGNVLSGLPLRGEIGYRVPADASTVYLLVQLDIFSGTPRVYEIDLQDYG